MGSSGGEAAACRRAGPLPKVQINTTVTRHDLTGLPGIARLVRDEDPLLWSVFLPAGAAPCLS